MKPVISPIWFYLVNLFSKVGDFAMALIIGGIILAGILTLMIIIIETEGDFESEEDGIVVLKKLLLLSLPQEFCIVRLLQKQLVTK